MKSKANGNPQNPPSKTIQAHHAPKFDNYSPLQESAVIESQGCRESAVEEGDEGHHNMHLDDGPTTNTASTMSSATATSPVSLAQNAGTVTVDEVEKNFFYFYACFDWFLLMGGKGRNIQLIPHLSSVTI
uniref:Uncharacterized protein n=1 Tax=Strigamia maritima TaxID=126957 RepID=T1IY62_STRMM